jgi:hypothetical protein
MARLSQGEVDLAFLEEIPDHQGKKTIFFSSIGFLDISEKTMGG